MGCIHSAVLYGQNEQKMFWALNKNQFLLDQINTTSPSTKLEVGNLTNGQGLTLSGTTTNETLKLLWADNGANGYWYFQPGTSTNAPLTFYNPTTGSTNGIQVRNNGGSFNSLQLFRLPFCVPG